jgi:NAD(P)-dependent dehydrogenase (short-subunit alcohol dehydrogenase family)
MSNWLITGCSTGLGRALAEAVIAAGHNAVVTARDVGKISDIGADNTDRVLAVPLDVTDPAQVTGAVGRAEERFGSIDVLVNKLMTTPIPPANAVRNMTRRTAPSPAIQRRQLEPSSPRSSRTIRQRFYCWATMRSAPTAASPQPDWTSSKPGSISPRAPTSTPR